MFAFARQINWHLCHYFWSGKQDRDSEYKDNVSCNVMWMTVICQTFIKPHFFFFYVCTVFVLYHLVTDLHCKLRGLIRGRISKRHHQKKYLWFTIGLVSCHIYLVKLTTRHFWSTYHQHLKSAQVRKGVQFQWHSSSIAVELWKVLKFSNARNQHFFNCYTRRKKMLNCLVLIWQK